MDERTFGRTNVRTYKARADLISIQENMIAVIPASTLPALLPPDVLKCTEQLLVCLANDEGGVVAMGLTQYCVALHRREVACQSNVLQARQASLHTAHTISTTLEDFCADERPSVRTPTDKPYCIGRPVARYLLKQIENRRLYSA